MSTTAYSKLEADNKFANQNNFNQLKETVNSLSVNGGKIFLTLSEAEADLANISDNERVEVYADEDNKNGIYTKIEDELVFVGKNPVTIINEVFTDGWVDTGAVQSTTNTPASNSSTINTIHGVSGSIGIVENPFNKAFFAFAQKVETPVTQAEIRLFKGKTVGGELITKKRVSFTAHATAQVVEEVVFDEVIDYDGEMWMQALVNNPIAYKRVTPAVQRTSALGYGPVVATNINNLDGTVFNTGSGYVDLGITFNTLETELQLTDEGTELMSSAVSSVQETDLTTELLNAYLIADGSVVPIASWRTTEPIAVQSGLECFYSGQTSQTPTAVSVVGYNNVGEAVVLVPNGNYTLSPIGFIIPDGIVNIRGCGFNATPPKIFIKETKINPELLPSENSKINIPLKWNCVGHSIWWQDANVYASTSIFAIGIQSLVKKIFKFLGYNKYCYSGNSLGQTSVSDTASIISKFPQWTDNSPAFWTVDTITNDFKRNIPIGLLSDYTNNTGGLTYYGALRLLKDKIESLTPNAVVIASNALKRNNDGYTSTSTNTVGAKLSDYEFALMQVCQLNKWRFIDQFRQSEITDETISITTTDGLHLNDFGYSLVSKLWIDNIWILANEK